jgi:dolichol kinase
MVMQSLEARAPALPADFRPVASDPPVARPGNYARNVFHVSCGLVALTLLRLLPGRGWVVAASGTFAAWAWSMEALRRRSPALNDRLMRAFGPVAHPHEWYRVNSGTWYATALLLLALLAPTQAAAIAVLVLAFADPAAAIVGRRFGRTRLLANRSLEGTLAFVTFGTAAALGALVGSPLRFASMLVVAVAASIAGALAELFSGKLDDNFTVPLVVAAAATTALTFV